MQKVVEKFEDRVEFVFVYCKEAHPGETEPVSSWKDRVRRARKFQELMQCDHSILVDEFEPSSVQKQFAAFENSGFVIDSSGRIVLKMAIASPQMLERFLETVIGNEKGNLAKITGSNLQ